MKNDYYEILDKIEKGIPLTNEEKETFDKANEEAKLSLEAVNKKFAKAYEDYKRNYAEKEILYKKDKAFYQELTKFDIDFDEVFAMILKYNLKKSLNVGKLMAVSKKEFINLLDVAFNAYNKERLQNYELHGKLLENNSKETPAPNATPTGLSNDESLNNGKKEIKKNTHELYFRIYSFYRSQKIEVKRSNAKFDKDAIRKTAKEFEVTDRTVQTAINYVKENSKF